jgi:heat shock protein HslJ
MRPFVQLALAASLLTACASPPPFEPTAPPAAAPAPAPVVVGAFDAASLAGSVWSAVDMNGIRMSQGQQVKLQFVSATEVAGFGGCNSFTGRADLSGGKVRLGPLAATQRACAPQPMAEEAMYFGALGKARSAREENGQLILLDEAGKPLVRFSRGE